MKILIGLIIFTASTAYAGNYKTDALIIKTVLSDSKFQKVFGDEPIRSMFRLSEDSIAFSGLDETCSTIARFNWEGKKPLPVIKEVNVVCE